MMLVARFCEVDVDGNVCGRICTCSLNIAQCCVVFTVFYRPTIFVEDCIKPL